MSKENNKEIFEDLSEKKKEKNGKVFEIHRSNDLWMLLGLTYLLLGS